MFIVRLHMFMRFVVVCVKRTLLKMPICCVLCKRRKKRFFQAQPISIMPYSTGRTTGNWITRTTYVNTKAEKPHQSYVFLKGMTFPLVILGIIAILTATATGLSENAGKIQLALGIFFLLPPLLDYLFYRFKSDDLGLWDTLFGGVWLVKTAKTAESKGWLKRLEQLGDYTEAQGWLSDGDSKDSSD